MDRACLASLAFEKISFNLSPNHWSVAASMHDATRGRHNRVPSFNTSSTTATLTPPPPSVLSPLYCDKTPRQQNVSF